MRHALLLTFGLLLAAHLFGQNSKVRGTVADKGQGLAHTEVVLWNGLVKQATVTTDSLGHFAFTELLPGDYDVEVRIGSATVTQHVALESRSTWILHLYDAPPCACCPAKSQFVANPSWHGNIPRPDLDLRP